jgi:hypothetical protein
MAGPVSLLRRFLRDYFTRKYVAINDKPLAIAQDTTRKAKSRKRYRNVPPSERFVWAMLVLIIALVGLVAIEIAIILVTGDVNDAILIVVSGLVGALASRFLEAKR